jgi:apolipoprotein D and lipocalin family protein
MKIFHFMLVLSLAISACSTMTKANEPLPPLEVVEHFDIQKYLGKWYEISSIRHSFEKDCFASTATYSLRANGDVDVLNECHQKSLEGKVSMAHGKAWAPNPAEPAKLLVQFFWPFRGDYWVIELGENYDYAVVGDPSRDYLWVLSRTPQMDSKQYDDILSRLKDKGYDLFRVEVMPQPGDSD